MSNLITNEISSQSHKYLSLKEIQQEELKLLKEFRSICEKNGLIYSLIGGSLLGAVRHKGFIPWDDDIDVGMPRADYEKFIALISACDEGYKYDIETFPSNSKHACLIKFISKDIYVQQRYKEEANLWIDVLPIDNLPASTRKVESIYNRAKILRSVIQLSKALPGEGKTALKAQMKRFAVPLINHFSLAEKAAKQLDVLAKKCNSSSTGFIGIVTYGMYGPGERMPDTALQNMPLFEFEDDKFPGFSCWDEYLHGIYGDYMELPPEDKRHTHEIKAWRATKEEENK